jgi:transposase
MVWVVGEPVIAYKGRDANQVVDQALDMYERGIEITDAAKSIGVPARTIHRWLATNATERWHDAQKGRLLADYEECRKRREEARTTLQDLQSKLDEEGVTDNAERNWRLAHAREVLRFADSDLDHHKWLLERLISRIYGQTSKLQVEVVDDLGERLRRARGRTIEAESVVVEQQTGEKQA